MSTKKTSFVIPKELADYEPDSVMRDMDGIYFTFMSDMAKIAEILPAPLEPAFPMVSGYVLNIGKTAFCAPYREAMLGVYVKYQGRVGMYPVTFLLSGEGTEMATFPGRERFGLPKKMCEREDCIRIERNGDVARGIVERHGVRLLDVSIKLGEYNNPMTGGIYSDPAPGKKTGGESFYFRPVTEPDEKGIGHFAYVDLYSNGAEYTYKSWEPGKVTVRLQSSVDDPWGHFPVLENLGGAYAENDLAMKELFLLEKLDPEEAMPKLLSVRYDRSVMKKG